MEDIKYLEEESPSACMPARINGTIFTDISPSSASSRSYIKHNFSPNLEWKKKQTSINPFQPMFHFYTPLKTSENLRFSDVFRGGIEAEH